MSEINYARTVCTVSGRQAGSTKRQRGEPALQKGGDVGLEAEGALGGAEALDRHAIRIAEEPVEQAGQTREGGGGAKKKREAGWLGAVTYFSDVGSILQPDTWVASLYKL